MNTENKKPDEEVPKWASDLIKKLDKYTNKVEKIEKEMAQKVETTEPTEMSSLRKEVQRIEDEFYRTRVTENNQTYSTEISMPTFSGSHKDENPKAYLERVNRYFERKRVRNEDKILLIENSLKGAAGNWFSTVNYLCENYEDFKEIFLNEYWSRDIQLKIWSQFCSVERIKDMTLYREYFGRWIQKIRFLESPKLTEAESIEIISRHYPGHIQAMLMSMPQKTYSAANILLGKEDVHRDDRTGITRQQNSNNQGEIELKKNPFYRNTQEKDSRYQLNLSNQNKNLNNYENIRRGDTRHIRKINIEEKDENFHSDEESKNGITGI